MFVVALGGVRGVGKSTLARALAVEWQSVECISFSDRLWARAQSIDRTDFASLPLERRQQLRSEVDLEISRCLRSASGTILLDLHYTDYKEHDRQIIHSDVLFDTVDWLILLDAPAHIICSRRQSDMASRRDLDMIAIERERQSERWGFEQLSLRFGARAGRLIADGSPQELVYQLHRMCRES